MSTLSASAIFDAAELLDAPADAQLAGARGLQVADPLGAATRRDEVAAAVMRRAG